MHKIKSIVASVAFLTLCFTYAMNDNPDNNNQFNFNFNFNFPSFNETPFPNFNPPTPTNNPIHPKTKKKKKKRAPNSDQEDFKIEFPINQNLEQVQVKLADINDFSNEFSIFEIIKINKNNDPIWMLTSKNVSPMELKHSRIERDDVFIIPNQLKFFIKDKIFIILVKFKDQQVQAEGFIFNIKTQEWEEYDIKKEPEDNLYCRYPITPEESYICWNGIDQRKPYQIQTFTTVNNQKVFLLTEYNSKTAIEIHDGILCIDSVLLPKIITEKNDLAIQSRCGNYIAIIINKKETSIFNIKTQELKKISSEFINSIDKGAWCVNSLGELIIIEDKVLAIVLENGVDNQKYIKNNIDYNTYIYHDFLLSMDLNLIHIPTTKNGLYILLPSNTSYYNLQTKQFEYPHFESVYNSWGRLAMSASNKPIFITKNEKADANDDEIPLQIEFNDKKYYLSTVKKNTYNTFYIEDNIAILFSYTPHKKEGDIIMKDLQSDQYLTHNTSKNEFKLIGMAFETNKLHSLSIRFRENKFIQIMKNNIPLYTTELDEGYIHKINKIYAFLKLENIKLPTIHPFESYSPKVEWIRQPKDIFKIHLFCIPGEFNHEWCLLNMNTKTIKKTGANTPSIKIGFKDVIIHCQK